jgi:hypothetical protein
MTKPLRKSRSKIAMLPETIRMEINRRIRNGSSYLEIVHWLFEQKAECEISNLKLKKGDSYSLAWARDSKMPDRVEKNATHSLSTWFLIHYHTWLREEVKHDKSILTLKEMQELSSVASEEARPGAVLGGNMLIQSMLLETIKLLHEENADPREISRLASAWARLNQTATENEKLKLRTEDSVDAGLEALKAEITKDPETVELFKKLHDIVKGSPKPIA